MGRIVIFAKRWNEQYGTTEYLFDITTPADREQRTGELSRQGYEVYSGPAASDEVSPEA